MPYAFKYDCYNKGDDDRPRKDQVQVTIKAEDEQDAESSVKLVLVRDSYALDEIVELSEDLMPLKSGY